MREDFHECEVQDLGKEKYGGDSFDREGESVYATIKRRCVDR